MDGSRVCGALALACALVAAGCAGASSGPDASASACKEGEFHYVDQECQQLGPPLGRICTGRGDGLCYERCETAGQPCARGKTCREARLYEGAGQCPFRRVNLCVLDGWKDGCQWPGPDAGTAESDASQDSDGSTG